MDVQGMHNTVIVVADEMTLRKRNTAGHVLSGYVARRDQQPADFGSILIADEQVRVRSRTKTCVIAIRLEMGPLDQKHRHTRIRERAGHTLQLTAAQQTVCGLGRRMHTQVVAQLVLPPGLRSGTCEEWDNSMFVRARNHRWPERSRRLGSLAAECRGYEPDDFRHTNQT